MTKKVLKPNNYTNYISFLKDNDVLSSRGNRKRDLKDAVVYRQIKEIEDW